MQSLIPQNNNQLISASGGGSGGWWWKWWWWKWKRKWWMHKFISIYKLLFGFVQHEEKWKFLFAFYVSSVTLSASLYTVVVVVGIFLGERGREKILRWHYFYLFPLLFFNVAITLNTPLFIPTHSISHACHFPFMLLLLLLLSLMSKSKKKKLGRAFTVCDLFYLPLSLVNAQSVKWSLC